MEIVSAKKMQELDRRTIQEIGIPGLVLMERAGLGAFELISSFLVKRNFNPHQEILILAGKGNNGGDGMVIARLLYEAGYRVKLLLFGAIKDLQGEPETNMKICRQLEIPLEEVESIEEVKGHLNSCGLVVDSLLGTGLSGQVRGLIGETISLLEDQERLPVISIDIPSGLNADTGHPLGAAVRATMTVTFGLPKLGQYLHPGPRYVGELAVVDIGIPERVRQEAKLQRALITPEWAGGLLFKRPRDSHKGDYGYLLLLAGSIGMTGAAALAARAALRAGCGLLTLGLPASLNGPLEAKLTETMTRPLPEEPEGYLAAEALEGLSDLMPKANMVALGPGLGVQASTARLVSRALLEIDKPLLLDADGINLLEPQVLKEREAPTIITPHPGELSRLLGVEINEIQQRRLEFAESTARDYGVTVVLKGVPTIVSSPEGRTMINTTGNPGMATAGSGDVLTGIMAALLGQALPPLEAAAAAVFLHGLAGDLGSKELGEASLVAGDLISFLPEAIQKTGEEGDIH